MTDRALQDQAQPLADGDARHLPRLAIFGDSHYACLRQAHGQGLIDPAGVEIEYWGHVGKRFRFLSCQGGAIVPDDDYTAQRFAKFNEKGRTFLPAADFDMIFFMSCRIDLTALFQTLLGARRSGPFLSSGLQARMAADRLAEQRLYTYAKALAETRTARIVLAPVTFPTLGYAGMVPPVPDAVHRATAEDRAAIWQMLADKAASDGITLLPQPEETIASGIFTHPDYAIADYEALDDHAHRNAAYGALIYRRVLALLSGKAAS